MNYFFILLFILLAPKCHCQDTIRTAAGENIAGTILELNSEVVRYKRAGNPDGPVFVMSRLDVVSIRYGDGSIVTIADQPLSESRRNELYEKGRLDASLHYRKYRNASTGVLVSSMIATPVGGLIPAILCSSIPPKDKNLGYPNEFLIKQPDYYDGYVKQAKVMKQEKVWTNWGIMLGIQIGFILLTLNE